MFRKVELEWKILLVAIVILFFVTVPLRSIFEQRLESVVSESVDSNLEPYLRERLTTLTKDSLLDIAAVEEKEQVLELLARHRQWRSLQSLVLQRQKRGFTNFTYVLIFLSIVATFFIFYRLTLPIKRIARQVKIIGAGGSVDIDVSSSGALGVLEQNVMEMQNELVQLRHEAELRGMESAWRDIARIMAHEIKNPLTPMRLNVDRLEEQVHLRETISSEKAAVIVERLNRQLDALESLVNRFRSFSSDQKVELRDEKVKDLIEHTSEDFSQQVTTTIQGAGTVLADRSLFQQVVLNLYKNSINAGADHITVTIEERRETVDISIADNGRGADSADVDKLFLPYITFTEGGSGIGLSVVKKLVESMGGEVSASSTTGVGFTVVLTLNKSEMNKETLS